MNQARKEQIRRALLRQIGPRGVLSEEKKQPGRVSEEKKRIEDTLERVLSPVPPHTPPPYGGHDLRERVGGYGRWRGTSPRGTSPREQMFPPIFPHEAWVDTEGRGAAAGASHRQREEPEDIKLPPIPQPSPTLPPPAPRTTIEQAVNVFQGAQPTLPIPEPVGGVAQISAGEEEKKYPEPDNQTDSTTGLQMVATPSTGVVQDVIEGEEDETSEEVFDLSGEEELAMGKKGKHIHLPKLLTKHGVNGLYKKLVKHPEIYEQHFGTESYEHLMSILRGAGHSLNSKTRKNVEKMLEYDKQVRAKKHTRKNPVPGSSSTTLPLVTNQEKAPEPPALEVSDDNATDAEKNRIAEANAEKMAQHNLAMVAYEAQHASEMDELKKRNEMVRQGITNYEIQSNIINAGKKSELQEKIDKLNVKTEIKEAVGSALQGQPQFGIGEKKIIPPYKALDLKQNTQGGVVFDKLYQDANKQEARDFRRGELILQRIPRLKQVYKILDKVEKESERKILTQQPRDIYRVSVWERVLRRFPSQGVPIPRPERDHNFGYEEPRIVKHYDDGVGRGGYYRFPDALEDETANTFLIC